ncbi:protein FAM83F isoform X2 [Leuresthes tenuis]|uniref:protein FAM83F isoform X2 n=1 Tax=Leuresthes tenuis TaxID=355514 RepID=UPI003B50D715
MAESQLMCMEDGQIGAKVPESKPEFYYSEEQRAAIEQLLKNGDGAFKTRLKEDEMKDFLSAREVKQLLNTFRQYDSDSDRSGSQTSPSGSKEGAGRTDADSGVHSTYWPQMSDTEVPPLDIGWPSGGLFKGVTRVAVHTHPPKDNGPHIKEVVRRLIQEASKNLRARTLQGVGFGLSFGRLPGSLCNKYMLVDGDKVMFGSYSFSWCTSRMDRNMITVMTGQVVDFFDRDFRELYAISEKLDLYKEFHVSPPAGNTTAKVHSKVEPKRPPLPATTSRFQVSLGDSRNPDIQVPAHKYYNPKYLLAYGNVPPPTGSLKEPGHKTGSVLAEVPEEMDQGRPQSASSEKSLQPSEALSESLKKTKRGGHKERGHSTWKKFLMRKSSSKHPLPTETSQTDEMENTSVVNVLSSSKEDQRTSSQQTVNTSHDNENVKGRRGRKKGCAAS